MFQNLYRSWKILGSLRHILEAIKLEKKTEIIKQLIHLFFARLYLLAKPSQYIALIADVTYSIFEFIYSNEILYNISFF